MPCRYGRPRRPARAGTGLRLRRAVRRPVRTVKAELVVLVAQPKKDLFFALKPLRLQLRLKPLLIKAFPVQVGPQAHGRPNQLGKNSSGRRRTDSGQSGRRGPLSAYGQNGQLAVVFKYGRLYGAQVEIPGLPAQQQKFA